MSYDISYVVWKEDDGFVVKCLEYPVTTQGDTKEEAVASLKEAVELYLEEEKTPYHIANFETGKLLVHA